MKAKATRPSRRTVYTRRRNPQVYRLQTAIRFFSGWEQEKLVEKAGNLVGRVLAINKVMGSEHGQELLSDSTREVLLTLYSQLVPEEAIVKYRRKKKDAEGEGGRQDEQVDEGLRGDDDEEGEARLDVQGDE